MKNTAFEYSAAKVLTRGTACLALLIVHFPADATAQSFAPGAIEGIVTSAANEARLENARVMIEGAAHAAFTDADGEYRISQVPAGSVRLRVFFTGMKEESAVVTVTPGAATRQDFNLQRLRSATSGAAGEVVKLDAVVVAETAEMEGAAIAINEQRFAPNMRHVVTANEFGPVVDDNVGEILKFLPGIEPVLGEGAVRSISINGVPEGNVPVTLGGFDVASAQGTSRHVDLIFASTNNLSRIEAVYSPTPETPGSALAGSINMVPRSAFERSKPVFSGSAYLLARDNPVDLDKTPGPGAEQTRKIRPGFNFSYIAPVNKRFGFTVSANTADQYLPSMTITLTRRGATAATNGGTFPDTTPDLPYLTEYAIRDFQAETRRSAAGVTADFKLSDHDRLSFGFQYVSYQADSRPRTITFQINRVLLGDFTREYTHGFTGAGLLGMGHSAFTRDSRSIMPTLTYRHNGPVWNLEAGVGLSHSNSKISEMNRGYFTSVSARRTGVTVSFDDIGYIGPRRITVTDGTTGAAVDPFDPASYAFTAATGRSHHENTGNWGEKVEDMNRSAYTSAKRDFSWRVPVSLKAGLDVRQKIRDQRAGTTNFTFVGPDGRASTTPTAPGSDDNAVLIGEPYVSDRMKEYGFPRLRSISPEQALELYRANPAYFTIDPNAEYRSAVNNSKHAEEIVSSAYFRADTRFLDGRLKLVGGLRAEQTNVKAEGPLTDVTRNFQRDSSGRVLLGANGQPLRIATDAFGISRLTLIDRGMRAEKEYLRWFPSLNASYHLRENLVARAAYYHSVGRPNFNQYAGGLTLPNLESTPSASNQIEVNNAGIKAWSARSFKASLEYYFEGVGLFSVGAFGRDFDNFFGSVVMRATPEFLALYNLDPAVYGEYDVATQFNLSTGVRMQGFEVNYKQALTFLPHWARGIQVFANAAAQRAIGDDDANFAGFLPRTASWGVSLSRERFNMKVNWNYRGAQRRAQFTGRSIAPGTFNWGEEQLRADMTAEYYFLRKYAAFVNVRDIATDDEVVLTHNPQTPDWAKLRQHKKYGALWTVGIKASF